MSFKNQNPCQAQTNKSYKIKIFQNLRSKSRFFLFLLMSCLLLAGVQYRHESRLQAATGAQVRVAPQSTQRSSHVPALSQEGPIAESALQQMQWLIEAKAKRTPVQRKIDSNLLFLLETSQGTNQTRIPNQMLKPAVQTGTDGRVEVEICSELSDDVLQTITAIGGHISYKSPKYRTIQAKLPLASLEKIAAFPEVYFIQPRQEAFTRRAQSPKSSQIQTQPATDDSFEARSKRVQSFLTSAIPQLVQTQNEALRQPSKVNTTEADVAHRARLARTTFNADGTGIKVGVLSDSASFAQLRSLQRTGDLPANVTILPGQEGEGSDEGLAMLEIIHDMAPGAQLFFATAFNGITSFGDNIRALRDAGCDIIVDDVGYFAETVFQDGQAPNVISRTNGGVPLQAVIDVSRDGAIYFSSAGNSGNKNDGTSGAWEGDFVDGGPIGRPIQGAGSLHAFAPGKNFNVITELSGGSRDFFTLNWSDPMGGSANDYDFFLLDATGRNILGFSTNPQDGSPGSDPFEIIPFNGGSTVNTGIRLVVVKRPGAAIRALHISTNRGELEISTSGQIYGHACAGEAYGVAAVNVATAQGGIFRGGAANPVETFSTDGLRRLFFDEASNPLTPGNLLFATNGGVNRQKPDIAAADGVSTATDGFNPFFGTSAAAPHAAAIAALIQSADRSLKPTDIRTILQTSALDIEELGPRPGTGVDRDSGFGLIDTFVALAQVKKQAVVQLKNVTFREAAGGNGNGFVEPGESGELVVTVENVGGGPATDVMSSFSLASPVPGVTLNGGSAISYGTVAPFEQKTATVPVIVALSPTAPCGAKLGINVSASFTGGPSPSTDTISLQTGFVVAIDGTLGNPVSSSLFTSTTGIQVKKRLARSGTEFSTCETPKRGQLFDDEKGQRKFDAYTLKNPTSSPLCVTVAFSSTCGSSDLFSAAYAPAYNPKKAISNYLGDATLSSPGQSAEQTYSFMVPANSDFVILAVAVNRVGDNDGTGCPYKIRILGVGCGSQ